MKSPFKLLVPAFLALLVTSGLRAQAVQNVRAAFLDGKVAITYDLTGGKANQKYTFELYSSHNSYSIPLRRVTGDVGKNISLGLGKKIEWDAAAELGLYNGDITFKVRGEPLALAFQFLNPVSGGSVKRGKGTTVDWEGGKREQDVKLELFEGSQRVQTLTTTKNTGTFNWDLPADMKKGAYTLKLTAGQETVESGVFVVKSKIPMLLKVLPVIVIGGVVAALGGGGGGGDKGTPTNNTASDLPAAPGPK